MKRAFDHIKLSRYAKSVDCVFIDYLGIKVVVECAGFSKSGKVVHAGAKVHSPLVHSLPLKDGLICAISPDLSKILGTFVSISEAARELDIDRKKIPLPSTSFTGTGTRELVRYIGSEPHDPVPPQRWLLGMGTF